MVNPYRTLAQMYEGDDVPEVWVPKQDGASLIVMLPLSLAHEVETGKKTALLVVYNREAFKRLTEQELVL